MTLIIQEHLWKTSFCPLYHSQIWTQSTTLVHHCRFLRIQTQSKMIWLLPGSKTRQMQPQRNSITWHITSCHNVFKRFKAKFRTNVWKISPHCDSLACRTTFLNYFLTLFWVNLLLHDPILAKWLYIWQYLCAMPVFIWATINHGVYVKLTWLPGAQVLLAPNNDHGFWYDVFGFGLVDRVWFD